MSVDERFNTDLILQAVCGVIQELNYLSIPNLLKKFLFLFSLTRKALLVAAVICISFSHKYIQFLITMKAKGHLHLKSGPLLHFVTKGRPAMILPAPPFPIHTHSLWLKLMAPSTHCDTDVLLGAGYCLAQRNQCSPIHKSNHSPVKQSVCNAAAQ